MARSTSHTHSHMHVMAAVLVLYCSVRWMMGLGSYSGMDNPPRFGDYEAQRHWMEITVHCGVGEWYHNTSSNDLDYWGLDYPPLTAYHSLLLGHASHLIEPQSVALGASRGYETQTHKTFMRASALLSDVLCMFPAMLCVVSHMYRRAMAPGSGRGATLGPPTGVRSEWNRGYILQLLVCTFNPTLLIIDHGHFQYNSVSIALAIGAVWCIARDWDLTGSVLFCLSLNFKQMSLFYSPAFFFYLLSKAYRSGRVVTRVFQLGVTVLATFALLWAPFCALHNEDTTCVGALRQVLVRLFPFQRGIFEDKVANLWYFVSVVSDIRFYLSMAQLKALSLGATLTLLAPMAVTLFAKSLDLRRFILALFTSSMAFFLCAFQVHEKSILMPASVIIFLYGQDALFVSWFNLVAMFSMFPLLSRDGLRCQYFGCVGVLLLMVLWNVGERVKGHSVVVQRLRQFVVVASCIGMLALHVSEAGIEPPARYPDLYQALFSLFAFGNFVAAYLHGLTWIWATPSETQGHGQALEENEKRKRA